MSDWTDARVIAMAREWCRIHDREPDELTGRGRFRAPRWQGHIDLMQRLLDAAEQVGPFYGRDRLMTIAQMRRLWDTGASLRKLASFMGTSEASVRGYLVSDGAAMRPKGRPKGRSGSRSAWQSAKPNGAKLRPDA